MDASLKDVVMSRVFVPNPNDVPAVVEILGEKFKGTNPATTITCAPLAAEIYKVEIEVTAYCNTQNYQVEEMKITA
jgi:enamine deaminase RidA (YjgF/YER057c/UK114 family)